MTPGITAEQCIHEATHKLTLGDAAGALQLAQLLLEKFGHPQGARIGAFAAHRLGDTLIAERLYQSALALFPADTALAHAYRSLLLTPKAS